jgi:hypothetical protein
MLPLILLGLVYGAWRLYENQVPGVMTPERKAIYMSAMQHERDPAKLQYWAKWYEDNGFPTYATNLRKRIQIPAMHGEARAQRQTIVRRAFSSENPYAIREVADRFLDDGRGATYQELQDYANGLEIYQSLDSVYPDYPVDAGYEPYYCPPPGGPIPYGKTPPLPVDCAPYGYPPPPHDHPPETPDMKPGFGQDNPPPITYSLSGNDLVLSPDTEAGFAVDPAIAAHVQTTATNRANATGKPVAVWSNDMQNQLLSVSV